MPALNPPGMQIGGPEIGRTPLPPTGPSAGSQMAQGLWGIQTPLRLQSSQSSTSVSGPTSYSLSFTASQPLSTLIFFAACCSSSGASLGATPAGWTRIVTQTQSTLDFGVYIYPQNPGGITSFALASITATTGGAAGLFYEVSGIRGYESPQQNQGSSTTPATTASGASAPGAVPSYGAAAIAYVAGATFTNSGSGTAMNGTAANTTSTGGVTNVALYFPNNGNNLYSFLGQQFTYKFAGSLTVSSVWAAGLVILDGVAATVLPGDSYEASGIAVDQGAGYGVSATGASGWAPGNTTKPGAAGGNQ